MEVWVIEDRAEDGGHRNGDNEQLNEKVVKLEVNIYAHAHFMNK